MSIVLLATTRHIKSRLASSHVRPFRFRSVRVLVVLATVLVGLAVVVAPAFFGVLLIRSCMHPCMGCVSLETARPTDENTGIENYMNVSHINTTTATQTTVFDLPYTDRCNYPTNPECQIWWLVLQGTGLTFVCVVHAYALRNVYRTLRHFKIHHWLSENPTQAVISALSRTVSPLELDVHEVYLESDDSSNEDSTLLQAI